MAISIDRLTGGNTPADGSDPRTFPAIWNATAAILEANVGEGGASVTVSETEPVDPAEGDLWLNSTEAKMYVYYDDGDSEQWVAAVGGTVPQQGKIVGFESVLKTDTWSASVASGGNAAITDLSITYSLSNASNKLMITAFCGVVSSSAGFGNMGLGVAADGTLINVGDAASPRTSVQAGGYSHSTVSSGDIIASLNAVTVYAPGTTSAVTYTVRAINNDGSTRTLYANRSASDTGVTAYPRAVSSFIIQEVAA